MSKYNNRSDSKIVKQKVQRHIKNTYPSAKLLKEDAIAATDRRHPGSYNKVRHLAEIGQFLIYYDDQREFLDSLKLKGGDKEFGDERVYEMYKHLIAREGAKMIDELDKKNYM